IADTTDDRLAVRARAGAVEGVRHLATSLDQPQNFLDTRFGMAEAFKHEHARAFGHHETIAVFGKRLGGRLRRIVRGLERGEKRKPDERLRIDRPISANAKRDLGLAASDRLDAELDGTRP